MKNKTILQSNLNKKTKRHYIKHTKINSQTFPNQKTQNVTN